MRAFDYHLVGTLPEALDLLARYGEDAHLMAGGTSLLLLMSQGLVEPGHVVSLQGVSALRGIRALPDGGLEIGALTTHREAEVAPAVASYCDALAHAFSRVATIRIRNQATVGGNLAHADPAQDPPPMLMALGAEVVIASGEGERTLALDEGFFVDYFETALQPGEVLTAVRLPPLPAGTQATYVKFLPRTEDDYATVAVAATLRLEADGETCADVRVALGAAGVTPIRARGVESALRGQRVTPEQVKAAAELVRDEVDPLDDVRGSADYKRDMAQVWTRRALSSLLERARSPQAAARNGSARH